MLDSLAGLKHAVCITGSGPAPWIPNGSLRPLASNELTSVATALLFRLAFLLILPDDAHQADVTSTSASKNAFLYLPCNLLIDRKFQHPRGHQETAEWGQLRRAYPV